MAYLGNSPVLSQQEYRNIDNISGSFNGVTTSFPLLVNGVAPVPAPQSSNQCLISVNGVVQKPDDTGASGFRLSGGNIVFSAAPTGGQSFFGVILAGADYIYAGSNFPDGTVTAPSITFAQDLDTGFYRSGAGEVKFTANGANAVTLSANNLTAPSFIPTSSTAPSNGVYLPAANNVAISTNGTGRLFINSSGQVGVGTSPVSTFHVNGTGRFEASQSLICNGTTGTYATWLYNGTAVGDIGTANQAVSGGGNTDFAITTRSATNLVFGIGTSERMRLDSSGGFQFKGAGTAGVTQAVSFNGSAPVNSLVVDSSGRVGLGTSTFGSGAGQGTGTIAQINGSLYVYEGTNTGNHGGAVAFGVNANASYTPMAQIKGLLTNAPGTEQQGDLAFYTRPTGSAGQTLTERLRITEAGRVGIGTQTPVGIGAGYTGLTINGSSASTLYMQGGGTSGGRLLATNTDFYIGTVQASGSVIFQRQDGSYESARIDSSGRLLVGTSTTGSVLTKTIELHSVCTNALDQPAYQIYSFPGTATSHCGYFQFFRSRGTSVGTNTIVASGDRLGMVRFAGANGTGYDSAAEIYAEVDGTPGAASDMPGRLVFSTTADGASSPTERMRISNVGKTSITAASGSGSEALRTENSTNTSGAQCLTTNLGSNCNNTSSYHLIAAIAGTDKYYIYGNGTTGTPSDNRLKKNIETARDGYLEDLSQLRVVKYNWNEQEDDEPKELGVIAQEVEAVFPGLIQQGPVKEDGTSYKGVKTSVLPFMLLKALQEATARIESLEAEVAALKGA